MLGRIGEMAWSNTRGALEGLRLGAELFSCTRSALIAASRSCDQATRWRPSCRRGCKSASWPRKCRGRKAAGLRQLFERISSLAGLRSSMWESCA